jgi:hypothetical protein
MIKIPPIYGQIYEQITRHKYYLFFLISLFFLIFIYYLITWPIVGYDTDLWYHLSGGRFFWLNCTIARDAFFSYITPPKSWYNYYWLFQVIIYKIFQWSGYYGLIVLRCTLYLLTAFFIYRSFTARTEKPTAILPGIFLFIACVIAILFRELLVRPHLFSYLFIVIFLYILELRRDKIWLLPFLGILWSNIHGIEYPVMLAIVFAYLAEIYYQQYKKRSARYESGTKTKWLLIAVFYTIFFTPRIVELVQTPFAVSFQNAAYQHLYVAELQNIPLMNFFVFAPVTFNGLISSLHNMLVLLTVCFFLVSLWKKQLRVSHSILFFCSLFLLAQHARFTYEFILLSIPLLGHGMRLVTAKFQLPPRVTGLALPGLLIVIPVLVFSNFFINRPAYPLDATNLPTGVVNFLSSQVKGGRILNEANTGGYLPWALGTNFKIYMDMQMSIFSDTDFAQAVNTTSHANVFKQFIQKYDPSFISVALNRPYFKQIAAGDGQFVPVCFDQKEVLYVKKTQYREIAENYELKTIDPFTYREIKYTTQSEEQLQQIYAEAEKMYHQDHANYAANHILSSILIVRGEYDQALAHAGNIIQYYPDLSHGYALKADALFGKGHYEKSAGLYKQALAMGQTARENNVFRNLYASYVKMKKYQQAYRVLSQYVNPFDPNADYKDIYDLGMSAATVGKIREAKIFVKIAAMKMPAADKEYQQKILEGLTMLGEETK